MCFSWECSVSPSFQLITCQSNDLGVPSTKKGNGSLKSGRLAQLVQSIPTLVGRVERLNGFENILGRLAQLVQSTSFTPRGSGVRISHRPHKASQFREAFFVYG